MSRRNLIGISSYTYIDNILPSDKQLCVAGDICFYSKVKNTIIVVSKTDFQPELYPANEYTPIGVVVVPSSHNIYGANKCSIISLNWINSNSETGGAAQSHYWLGNTSSIGKTQGVPLLLDMNSNTGGYNYYIGVGDFPYQGGGKIPTNNTMDIKCGYGSHTTNGWYVPSPYLNDDSKNPSYFMNSFNSNNTTYINGLTDFSGSNILLLQKSYTPFDLCNKYYTDGTIKGGWYIPTIGELGYLMARIDDIENSINIIKSNYGIGYSILNYGLSQDEGGIWAANVYQNNTSVYHLVIHSSGRGRITYTSGVDRKKLVRAMKIIDI